MDTATLATIQNLIGTLGFPIVVACWLLFKGSKDSQNIQAAINAQNQSISAQTVAVEKLAAAVEMLSRTQQK